MPETELPLIRCIDCLYCIPTKNPEKNHCQMKWALGLLGVSGTGGYANWNSYEQWQCENHQPKEADDADLH